MSGSPAARGHEVARSDQKRGKATLAQQDEIVIDIGRSGVTYDAVDGAFLHSEPRDRVLRALNAPIEPENAHNPDLSRPSTLNVRAHRRHETILVSARRGEGKTTFLTTILRSIENGDYRTALGEGKANALYSLGIIDPTLIETKQNIIVIVIDLLRSAANHRRQRMGHGAEEFEIVQSALRKLARGLTVLDGIGDTIYSGRDWVDVEFVLGV